ncbi:NPCBM/NEW2 domain-containing protein [Sphingomonas kyungheensis]|uniref:Alpha-galactosidase n=1 Tax=Sphingomonas kyungheensis TaxID=1069987 RepID=A0ABU8H7R2_9SPHN
MGAKPLLRTLLLAMLSQPLSAVAQVAGGVDPVGRWTARPAGGAAKPPMGWSSWNAFRTEIDEEKVLGSAVALVRTGLAKRGYVYVNVDDGWWLRRRAADGRLIVRTQIFPSAMRGGGAETSLRPLTDRLHAMGLKAGLYTDVGHNACSQAYDLSSPNLPVGTAAEREVGLSGHVDQDIRLFFQEWKFDFLKVDACGLADYSADKPYVAAQGYRPSVPIVVRGEPARTDAGRVRASYEEVAEAIRKYASGAYFSICVWGQADVRAWGKDVGNGWRTSEDITADWTSMLQSFDSTATRALYAHPGAWNDPDMLFIGSGDFDQHHLIEARTHFSLWAIVNAPLMIGYDLRQAPQSLLDIWGNADVIAVNQDRAGNQAVPAYRSADLDILVKTMADGRKAVAIFNRTAEPVHADLTAGHLKLAPDRPVTMVNLWDRTKPVTFSGQTRLMLRPHETLLFMAEGQPELAEGLYLSEMTGSINVAADGVRQAELDPTIHRGISAWSGTKSSGETPMYTGWGGAQPDVAPYGTPLTIAGHGYGRGIGILSNSRMEVRNDAGYAHFKAEVGIDDSTRNRSSTVRFSVYGDGRMLAETGPISFGAAAVPISADLGEAKTIELIARSGDGGASTVSVAWSMARMTK